MDMSEMVQTLAKEKAAIVQGSAERIAKQHADGKCTARERVAKLFDAGSFVEVDALREESHVVAGFGTVNGCAAYCFAQDYAACGGAMTRAQAEKIQKVLTMAKVNGAPVVALLDSEPDVLRYLARHSSRPYRMCPAFITPSQVAAS